MFKKRESDFQVEKIILHCPMNISRTLSNLIREFIKKEYGESRSLEIYDEPHRLGRESSLLKTVREGLPPALYVGHATDFGRMRQEEIAACFATVPDLPLGDSLINLGFKDSRRYFHPFTVIPFAVIYNKNLVKEELSKRWEDLHSTAYRGKIRLPDLERTISKVIVGAMKMKYPATCEQFLANCYFKGSPIDVVNSIDEGEYAYGMVNVAFSRFSRQKNTAVLWMEDGAFCMPQVIAVGKDKYEKVRKIVDYIFSEEVQKFFALQGFIPAASGEIPAILHRDNLKLIWNGWDEFIRSTV